MKKLYVLLFILIGYFVSYSQPITVDNTTYTVPELVEDVLIDSPCAIVSNISWNNCADGIGYFTNTNPDFPMSAGVVMSTGMIADVPGPNSNPHPAGNCGPDNDTSSSLYTYMTSLGFSVSDYNDVTVIEFDFLPFTDTMSFDFLFASEEYGNYQCSFADAFAFFLTNTTTSVTTNLALVPGTTDPISVLTIRNSNTLNAPVNNTDGTPCLSVNEQFFGIDNQVDPANAAINFNGQTVAMTAQSTVVPGDNYHIQLIIADRNDGLLNSAIFIGAGSFNVGTAEISYDWGIDTETSDMTSETGFLMCPGECKELDSGLGTDYTFVWTQDGVIMPTETGPTITVCTPGEYCVSASLTAAGPNACVQTDCLIVDYLPGVTVNPDPDIYYECDDMLDNIYTYYLNNHIAEVLGPGNDPADYDVSFYLTAQDAQDGLSQIPAIYTTTANPLTVYVRVESFSFSCPAFTDFDAEAILCSIPIGQPDDLIACDDISNDGVEVFDLTQQDTTILNGLPATDYTVTYHTTQAGADDGTFDLATPSNAYQNTTSPQTIYVRVEHNTSGNYTTTTFQLIVSGQPSLISLSGTNICQGQDAVFNIEGTPYSTIDYDLNGSTDDLTLDANGLGQVIVTTPTADQTITLSQIYIANCSEVIADTYTIVVNTTPIVDEPADVEACDNYTLPALTVGSYYDATGGTGNSYSAGDVITATTTLYVYEETGTTPNICSDEHVFTITINTTPVVDEPVDVEVCDSYTLPALTVGNYYDATGGTGNPYSAGDVITTTTTLYVYEEVGTNTICSDEHVFTVTINTTPVVDEPIDVEACDSYTLPALTVGNYYDATGGTGNPYSAGDVITATTTLYVYEEVGTNTICTDEHVFTVTINTTPVVDEPVDVEVCDSYTLPALTVGNYYDATGGTGNPYSAGDVITTTTTLYVYEEVGTNTICSDEHVFTVTINTTPVVDEPIDVEACDSYTLPALTVGNYYDATGGTGNPYSAGDVITATTTLYVYEEVGTNTICTDEHVFTVTINTTPVVDEPADVEACDSYTLPALTVGNYYDATGGTGNPYSAGDVITITATLYVYEEVGTNTICSDEHVFTVTINTTPVVDEPIDVTACDSYTLPALTIGNYYDATGGTGNPYSAGDVITTTTTLYVYEEVGTNTICTDEHIFTVTINTSPVVDEPADVEACDNYTLPALTVGNYYDATGGTGNPYSAGDVITATTTLYVYEETGTTPNCTDEHVFTVTINTTPVVDEPVDVTACDSYTLPALTVGNYYGATGGTGTAYNAGDVITATTTLYVYEEVGTNVICSDEHVFTITINPLPSVSTISNNGAICEGEDAVFTVNGTPNSTVTYTLDGGTSTATLNIPASGSTTVTVTGVTANMTIDLIDITNDVTTCSATIANTNTITVNPSPTATIAAASNLVCLNGTTTLTFTGTAGATVEFTDGTTTYDLTIGTTGTVDYTIPALTTDTTYTLTSVTSNTTPACSIALTDSQTISINPTPEVIINSFDDAICNGTLTDIAYTLNNATGLQWQATLSNVYFGDPSTSSGDQDNLNQVATLINPLVEGNITIQILPVLTGGDCVGEYETIVINVNPIPTVDEIIPSTTSICDGENVTFTIAASPSGATFQWTAILDGVVTQDGVVSGTTDATVSLDLDLTNASQAGELYIDVTPILEDCTGDTLSSAVITVNPIPGAVVSSPSYPICSGESASSAFNISLGFPLVTDTTVEWEIFDSSGVTGYSSGSAATTPFEIPDVLTTTGTTQGYVTYRIWTISPAGCTGEYTDFTVYVNPNPEPSLQGGSICVDTDGNVFQTFWLQATGNFETTTEFEWYETTNTTSPIAVTTVAQLEVDQAGNYYVVATNADGCYGISDTVSVIETNPATSVTAEVTEAFSDSATVIVTVTGSTNGTLLYQMDEGDYQSESVFTDVSSGEHTITVVDVEGCTYLTTTVMVVDYPKFFTPNGDGYNDTWNISGLNQTNARLYIFDRYGKLIKQLSPSDASSGWDGTFNGKQLPSTDYWFSLQYEEDGVAKEFKAHFSLKR